MARRSCGQQGAGQTTVAPTRPAALLRSLCSRQLPRRWQQFFGCPSHEFVLGLGTDLDERYVGEAHADELPGGGDVGGRIGPAGNNGRRSLLLRGRRPRRRRGLLGQGPGRGAVLVLTAPFVPESRATPRSQAGSGGPAAHRRGACVTRTESPRGPHCQPGLARSKTYPDGGYAPARGTRRLRCRRFALRRSRERE
jgi:hypothetical protein